MPNTYTLLETITVGAAGASSVTFNSIPQTGYTDLILKISARTNYAGVYDFGYLTINGTNTGTYRGLYGTGSAAGSETAASLRPFYFNANTATASVFSSHDVYIPNYTSSNLKSVSVDNVTENNATSAITSISALVNGSTSAVTQLSLSSGNSASFMQYSTFSLYGVSALGTTPTKAPKATGGDIIMTDGTYWSHTFLSSGTFTPATALSCEVLVVAGGGGGGGNETTFGGGGWIGGGGGAGGYRTATGLSVSSATTVTVGAGGAAGVSQATTPTSGTNGSDSVFSTITSTGGGYGGAARGSGIGLNGNSGGSGGGGGSAYLGAGLGGAGNTPSTSPSQGNNGGTASTSGAAGGGGGSAAVGTNGNSGGAGGAGTANSISGSSVTYATGGSSSTGTANTANTGNGGNSVTAGNSGIVIVRYLAA